MSNVVLIAYTQSCVPDIKHMQDLITYIARVSNPENQTNTQTSEKLLKYLMKNKHWSPFEMCNVVMEINTTRDISRQILRHRSFSFQEFSQRYADPSLLHYVVREARLQDSKNRQNSIEIQDEELQNEFNELQKGVYENAMKSYKWALAHNIAKEQARVVLPEGMIYSRLYMNGTLRSWVHYCLLRKGHGTQKEHQDIANQCWGIVCDVFPVFKQIDWDI